MTTTDTPWTLRRADERGRADHGWLDARHTFSFAGYFDPEHMGFRTLRVINEDRVAPGAGFGEHGNRDMEIVTFVISGALRHGDSLGNGSVIRPGQIQRMTAGTGVRHSEMNASDDEPVHLLQIWITPSRIGLDPGYEEADIPDAEGWITLASPPAVDSLVTVHQDAHLRYARLGPGEELELRTGAGRHAFVHVATGAVELDGHALGAGDAARRSAAGSSVVRGTGDADAQVLWFDLG